MMRLAALAALVSITTSACAMNGNAKGAAIAGGIATAVAGGLVFASGEVDADHNGVNENPFDDNWGAYMLGGLLLTAGIGLAIGGLAASASEEATAAPVLAPAPQAVVYVPQGMTFVPQQTSRAALPEMATNSEAIQDAQQIRSLVESRQCGAAWSMWHRLDVTDHAYAVAVRDGAVMARCPVGVATPMP